jgi:hypothetical protein
MSKKDNKRFGHKSARQAEKVALRGRLYSDTVRNSMSYSSKLPQPHIPDSAVTGGPSKKKNKSKWCKGHVGIEHDWYWNSSTHWRNSGWRCKRCSKRYWGTPPSKRIVPKGQPQPGWDHWSQINIWSRLAGHACQCKMCKETEQ